MTAVGPEMELIVILIMSHWRNLEISPLLFTASGLRSVCSALYLGNKDISHFRGKYSMQLIIQCFYVGVSCGKAGRIYGWLERREIYNGRKQVEVDKNARTRTKTIRY